MTPFLSSAKTPVDFLVYRRLGNASHIIAPGTWQDVQPGEAALSISAAGVQQGLIFRNGGGTSGHNPGAAGAAVPSTFPTNWTVTTPLLGITTTVNSPGPLDTMPGVRLNFNGTASGTGVISRIAFGPTAAPTTLALASSAQNWCGEISLRWNQNPGATPGVQLMFFCYDSTGVQLATPAIHTGILPAGPTATLESSRIGFRSGSMPTNTAFTVPVLELTATSGQVINNSRLDIILPQFANRTNPSYPPGVQETGRNGNWVTTYGGILIFERMTQWFSFRQGTMVIDFKLDAAPLGSGTTTVTRGLLSLHTDANERMYVSIGTSWTAPTVVLNNTLAGVNTAYTMGTFPGTEIFAKLALSYNQEANRYRWSFNGNVGTEQVVSRLPYWRSGALGGSGTAPYTDTTNRLGGVVRNFDYMPVELSLAELQALST